MPPDDPRLVQKGRGAASNPPGRFAKTRQEADDDGWGILDESLPPLATTVQPDASRTIIARNQSADIPFTQSINPYRGCEHGCVYCVSGDTLVLMADGSTRPIARVRPGDELYGTAKRGRSTRSKGWRAARSCTRCRPPSPTSGRPGAATARPAS